MTDSDKDGGMKAADNWSVYFFLLLSLFTLRGLIFIHSHRLQTIVKVLSFRPLVGRQSWPVRPESPPLVHSLSLGVSGRNARPSNDNLFAPR